jgi:hypothetical protein
LKLVKLLRIWELLKCTSYDVESVHLNVLEHHAFMFDLHQHGEASKHSKCESIGGS